MRQRDEGCEERGGKSVDTFNRVEKKRTTKDHRNNIPTLLPRKHTKKQLLVGAVALDKSIIQRTPD